jgi:hypothetical protein
MTTAAIILAAEVVVISQDETYWMDAPVFVRCHHQR